MGIVEVFIFNDYIIYPHLLKSITLMCLWWVLFIAAWKLHCYWVINLIDNAIVCIQNDFSVNTNHFRKIRNDVFLNYYKERVEMQKQLEYNLHW